LTGEFASDNEAAASATSAPNLVRMAEEALRNIERHAMASRVTITLAMKNETHLYLRINDDGSASIPAYPVPDITDWSGCAKQAQLIDADCRWAARPTKGRRSRNIANRARSSRAARCRGTFMTEDLA